MSLFTLIGRDRWGHGIPCAWMVSSNGQESTISFFLESIKARHPNITPEFFMTDKDKAQINSISRHFPNAAIELCWWHVLHAWQQHFSITEFPELWKLMKSWVRITDKRLFDERWAEIRRVAPQSVREYLEVNWMPITHMWSAVHRVGRTVFQECDTNMLVEAWHHLLKGKFMQGKRNRRLDQLIYILTKEVIPYFIQRHHAQHNGFHGGDLEVQARLAIEKAAASIPEDDITQAEKDSAIFSVKSQTQKGRVYCVDLVAYDCTCPSFPKIMMCKHVHAVQLNFAENCEPVTHASTFDIQSPDTFENDGAVTIEQPAPPSPANALSRAKDDLIFGLSQLVRRLHDIPGSTLDMDAITMFQSAMAAFSRRLPGSESNTILPPTRNVAPNQRTWTETAKVMGVKVKGKRPSAHTDPYAGGERSGKRAKSDALHPPKEAQNVPAPGPPLLSQSLPPAPIDDFLPVTFNINDTTALTCLSRSHLVQLCTFYGLPHDGSDLELVGHLVDTACASREEFRALMEASGLV